jgi:hypothetical protein
LSLIQSDKSSSGTYKTYSMGTESSFTGLNRTGCEADRLPLLSVELKSEWSYFSAPPYAFIDATGKTSLRYNAWDTIVFCRKFLKKMDIEFGIATIEFGIATIELDRPHLRVNVY